MISAAGNMMNNPDALIFICFLFGPFNLISGNIQSNDIKATVRGVGKTELKR